LVFLLALGLLAGIAWVQMQAALTPAAAFLLPSIGSAGIACLIAMTVQRCVLFHTGLWAFFSKSLFNVSVLIATGFAAAGYAGFTAQHALDERLPDHLDRQSLQLEVVVMDLPTRDLRSWRFEVAVRSALRTNGSDQIVSGFPRRGVVHWYFEEGSLPSDGSSQAEGSQSLAQSSAPNAISPGEIWSLQARVRQPSGTLNPGGFDYEAWMLEKGLSFKATVQQGKKHTPPQKIGETDGFQISIDRLRDRIRKRIDQALPNWESRHVLAALVVGDQRAIAAADWAVFQRTGVSHLMSISGLHVTMLAALFGWIGSALWRLLSRTPLAVGLWLPAQSVGALFAITGAIAYALLAGFAIPAQRTAWMVAVVCGARLFGIRANPWAVLSIALCVVLVSDPMAVLAPGFWLSFMAVGFLFTLPDLQGSNDQKTFREKTVATIRAAGHAQLAITFGLMPVTVLMFQQIVLVGPLANAVAIPVVSYLVTPFAMAGFIFAEFFELDAVLIAAAWAQQQLHGFLVWSSRLEFAAIDWPSPGLTRTVIASLGMVVALGNIIPRAYAGFRHLGWLGLATLWGVAPLPPAHGDMTLSLIDVGQGTSVLIRTQNHVLLYDTGPAMGSADAGLRMVMPVLRRKGIGAIDQLMVSHADSDHSGGLASILELITVKDLRTSWPSELAIVPTRRNPGIVARPCTAGQSWQWDGVLFEVLHPFQNAPIYPPLIEPAFDYLPQPWPRQLPKPDRNAESCVLRVQDSHGASILLTGDIPVKKEQTLSLSATQILMAPHHGSKTSTGDDLLAATSPQLVFIQSGYKNRFGHPHAEVLNRLQALGVPVLRTDLQGAIEIEWRKGERFLEDFWQQNRRYWHLNRAAPGGLVD
jgi:competence protein ComEC